MVMGANNKIGIKFGYNWGWLHCSKNVGVRSSNWIKIVKESSYLSALWGTRASTDHLLMLELAYNNTYNFDHHYNWVHCSHKRDVPSSKRECPSGKSSRLRIWVQAPLRIIVTCWWRHTPKLISSLGIMETGFIALITAVCKVEIDLKMKNSSRLSAPWGTDRFTGWAQGRGGLLASWWGGPRQTKPTSRTLRFDC